MSKDSMVAECVSSSTCFNIPEGTIEDGKFPRAEGKHNKRKIARTCREYSKSSSSSNTSLTIKAMSSRAYVILVVTYFSNVNLCCL